MSEQYDSHIDADMRHHLHAGNGPLGLEHVWIPEEPGFARQEGADTKDSGVFVINISGDPVQAFKDADGVDTASSNAEEGSTTPAPRGGVDAASQVFTADEQVDAAMDAATQTDIVLDAVQFYIWCCMVALAATTSPTNAPGNDEPAPVADADATAAGSTTSLSQAEEHAGPTTAAQAAAEAAVTGLAVQTNLELEQQELAMVQCVLLALLYGSAAGQLPFVLDGDDEVTAGTLWALAVLKWFWRLGLRGVWRMLGRESDIAVPLDFNDASDQIALAIPAVYIAVKHGHWMVLGYTAVFWVVALFSELCERYRQRQAQRATR